ncbi:MAG: GTP-binding protein [Tomitella sp.]|nr:GTP-binding protein [Tomitella sp.]
MTQPSRPEPVPVIVLAGFLGSGKTTVLNHLLGNDLGVRLGVIVNDFGDVGIDALMVAGQVDGAVDLGNGCVCCAVDVDELDETLEQLTGGPRTVDAVVIEASGLAEPRTLIRMIVGSSVPTVRYGGLVEVVDADAYPHNRRAHPELDLHVRLADLVVLNKSDLVGPEALADLRRELSDLCGPVPLIDAVRGRIDPRMLFDEQHREPDTLPRQMTIDELLRAPAPEHDHEPHASHLHDRYDSVSYSHNGPLHPRRLIELLENGRPGVYRMKGVVALADPDDCGTFEMQTVGRHVHARRRAPAGRKRAGPAASTFVAIGIGIDAADLQSAFDFCRVGPDEPADEQAMLSVLRYAE